MEEGVVPLKICEVRYDAIKPDGSLGYYYGRGYLDAAYWDDAEAVAKIECTTSVAARRLANADGADVLDGPHTIWALPGESDWVSPE